MLTSSKSEVGKRAKRTYSGHSQRVFSGSTASARSSSSISARSLIAAKNVSPLVVGRGGERPDHRVATRWRCTVTPTRSCIVEDDHLVHLATHGIDVYDREPCSRYDADWVPLWRLETRDISLGDYPHFMSKEMHEQPEVLERLANEAEADDQSAGDGDR